ncbi:Membrane-integrating protein Mistic [Bacillus sp. THAF10]|uniref:atypical membrane-integrating protein (Mistic protein) n=1 Tax=Bacillus sp. THAF10 TaxID=2587848 RepID=UPI0012696A82|nr:atypical membrane-integrating protein (Mistic protein) [Bacillus sp. THAF10]QFT90371.1 Membrane-integrating protein Mistic [Bacillus sp. THAF10]
MKLSKEEKEQLSEAIDKMNESLDVFIEYYNESEDDTPIISFDEEVLSLLEAGKEKYGTEAFSQRINTIMKEVLSFISKEDS